MIDYNDLIGIPFSEHGDGITGINCHELMRKGFAKHGIDVPETNLSVCASKVASNREITNKLLEEWKPINRPVVPCGILISSSSAHHIGVYVGENRILHVSMNTNSTIERLYPKYKNRVLGFYRFIGGK